jgi:uncharacterized protein (TIGR03435 family)
MSRPAVAATGILVICLSQWVSQRVSPAQSPPPSLGAANPFWDFPPKNEARSQPPLRFEVATVKTASGPGPGRRVAGGPGTSDPTRFTYLGFMSAILRSALGVKFNQFAGIPKWAGQEKFNIEARVPPGATAEQVQEMLLNLLKDRFHLAYHWTKKEIDTYTLVVAKGGPKLKAAAPASGPAPAALIGPRSSAPYGLDREGFPRLPEGYQGSAESSADGVVRMTFRMASPADLAARLNRGVFPLVDATGLTGSYDFTLEYDLESFAALLSAAPVERPSDPTPDIFTALEKQLGLKMEKGKTQIDVATIDHIDKTPTEN